jgi:polysaccharide biosynthesis/export protein
MLVLVKFHPAFCFLFFLIVGNFSPLLNAADATEKNSNPMLLLDNKTNLGLGDELSYRVVEDRDDVQKLKITDTGDVQIPYYGRVRAYGKTCQQLATEVKALLEKELYFQATVIISLEDVRKVQGQVYVVGAVGRPGPVDIRPGQQLTVSKAILAAGGFTQFSHKGKVKIVRKVGEGLKDTKEFMVDVGAVLEKGKLDKDMVVQDSDMVIVAEKIINF